MTAPLCAQDYADLARARLDPATWAWLESGGADELTARANLDAWPALRLRGRALRPLAGAHTRLELGGQALAHPILIAPTAWHGLVHQDGETATALAAAATNVAHSVIVNLPTLQVRPSAADLQALATETAQVLLRP